MFLRQGLSFAALGALFGVDEKTVSRSVNTVLPLLAQFFNENFCVPTKEQIEANYPEHWKESLNGVFVAFIIDGAEFNVQVSGNPVVQQVTYSYYKHHCTGKILVAITPDGYLAYISKTFGGHISDVEIVKQSGFLDHLKSTGMNVLADKGFTGASHLFFGASAFLFTPGRLGRDRQQFLAEEVSKNATYARHRIHVERAIKLIKNFNILNRPIPIPLWRMIDDMLAVIRGLCCLQGPLTTRQDLDDD